MSRFGQDSSLVFVPSECVFDADARCEDTAIHRRANVLLSRARSPCFKARVGDQGVEGSQEGRAPLAAKHTAWRRVLQCDREACGSRGRVGGLEGE